MGEEEIREERRGRRGGQHTNDNSSITASEDACSLQGGEGVDDDIMAVRDAQLPSRAEIVPAHYRGLHDALGGAIGKNPQPCDVRRAEAKGNAKFMHGNEYGRCPPTRITTYVSSLGRFCFSYLSGHKESPVPAASPTRQYLHCFLFHDSFKLSHLAAPFKSRSPSPSLVPLLDPSAPCPLHSLTIHGLMAREACSWI